ncbi:MAG TPA: TIGR01459 family HAD-type hydrolase [Beijerinckiaceae bacterium]|jgi:HAD superfamily hydrolase (TIGR01459 family)
MTSAAAAAPKNPDPIPLVSGLEEIASRYDVVLCDVWGVIHNGIEASAPACEALSRFRAGGGCCAILITNAPRPGSAVVGQLDRLAVPRRSYDAVVTSGDLTRAIVAQRRGEVVHHVGPERDKPIFSGLEVRFGTLDEADYVVCSGLFDDTRETADDYRPMLERMRARSLWMLCANPDLLVERGRQLIPCAGAIATAYEAIGGEVFYAGKPHRPIYEAALRLAGKALGRAVEPARVLAVGDAIRTDIAGARKFGIPSLLVARGIHAGELRLDEGLGASRLSSHVQDWLTRQSARPNAIMDRLVWS